MWFKKAAEQGIQYAKMELQRLIDLGYEPEKEINETEEAIEIEEIVDELSIEE